MLIRLSLQFGNHCTGVDVTELIKVCRTAHSFAMINIYWAVVVCWNSFPFCRDGCWSIHYYLRIIQYLSMDVIPAYRTG